MIDELAADDLGEDIGDTEESEEVVGAEDAPTDNVGDPSVEINVEELISELEADGLTKKLGGEQGTRKRLEELMERRRAMRELEDFDDYDI